MDNIRLEKDIQLITLHHLYTYIYITNLFVLMDRYVTFYMDFVPRTKSAGLQTTGRSRLCNSTAVMRGFWCMCLG